MDDPRLFASAAGFIAFILFHLVVSSTDQKKKGYGSTILLLGLLEAALLAAPLFLDIPVLPSREFARYFGGSFIGSLSFFLWTQQENQTTARR